jgi:dCTP deaminase
MRDMLSDIEIKEEIRAGNITIEPFSEDFLKANTYEFRLSNNLLLLKPGQTIDLRSKADPEYQEGVIPEGGFILKPKQFILASSIERVSTSKSISVLVDGISALSRIGLSIHQTSMHCKPGQGFYTVTLEMFNAGDSDIVLYPEIAIGKFLFVKSLKENSRGYESSYGDSSGPKGAKFGK